MKISPAIRLSLGLVFLTLSIVIIAQAIGLMPDTQRASIQTREKLTETIALQTMLSLKRGDTDQIRDLYDAAVENSATLKSIGLRAPSGRIIYQTSQHKELWKLPPNSKSTAQYILAPISVANQPKATVEFSFIPVNQESQFLFGLPHFIYFALFICLSGFVVYWFYIRRVLHKLDPNSVVPARVRNALNIMAEGVLILDRRERIMLANDEICHLLNLSEKKIIGRKISDMGWQMESTKGLEPPWETARASGLKQTKVRMSLKVQNKKEMIFRVNAVPVLDTNGNIQGVITSFDNISELVEKNRELTRTLKDLEEQRKSIEEKNKKLSFLASSDPLTGCYNRRTLFDYINRYFEIEAQERPQLSVIMADIDHFKKINDNYGHNFGDEAIRFVADVLKSNTRDDDMVVRFGGEEFCVLLPDTTIKVAYEIAERCRKHIQNTPIKEVKMTSSFGVSCQNFGADDATSLIHFADQALYYSKNNGRNRSTVWSSSLGEDSSKSPDKQAQIN